MKSRHLRYVTGPQVVPLCGMSRNRVGEGAVVGMPKTATVETAFQWEAGARATPTVI
jgi:hypothetical protein